MTFPGLSLQLTIWRFVDGNRAHEKQSAALIAGLRTCVGGQGVVCHNIPARGAATLLRRGVFHRQLCRLPRPQLIVGAGHRSHWPLLLARRQFGGRSVAIMRPSLPIGWFDFAIIPEHDRPPALPNVILSRGALAEPLPAGRVQQGSALLLLGGPSKHFAWDAESVERQLQTLLAAPLDWLVSDSRRTPADTLARLPAGRAAICSWRDCPPGWLPEQLARAEQVWVTGDSISMVFEALQSRARVGTVRLPSRRRVNKVRGAIQRLVDRGVITDRVDDVGQPVGPPREPLDEYIHCARALLQRMDTEV